MPKMVARYDQGEIIGRLQRTSEGFLTGKAVVSRAGIFTYRNADGTLHKELRHPEDVFKRSSLDSMKMKPVTNGHPPERILTSETVKERSIGHIGETVFIDGMNIIASITITDADGVRAVESGRNQLSLGYEVELVDSPGEFDGANFDFKQTNVQYNHCAIVDVARAGDVAEVHLDADDAVRIDAYGNTDAELTSRRRKALPDSAFCYVRGRGTNKVRKFPVHDPSHVRNALSRLPQSNLSSADKASILACIKRKAKQFGVEVTTDSIDSQGDDYNLNTEEQIKTSRKEGQMPQITLKSDGCSYEAEQQVINHISKLDGELAKAEAALSAAQKNLDAANAERDAAKDELSKMKDNRTDEIQKAVADRLVLERVATPILKDQKVDGMSDRDIRVAVITKVHPKVSLDGKSDDYISAMFDASVESIKEDGGDGDGDSGNSGGSGDDAMADQRRAATPRHDSSGSGDIVKDARERYLKRLRGEKTGK